MRFPTVCPSKVILLGGGGEEQSFLFLMVYLFPWEEPLPCLSEIRVRGKEITSLEVTPHSRSSVLGKESKSYFHLASPGKELLKPYE